MKGQFFCHIYILQNQRNKNLPEFNRERFFFVPTSLNTDLPRFLDCGFVTAHYSILPARGNSIILKAAPLPRRLGLGLSQRGTSLHSRTFHMGFLLDSWTLRQNDSKTSFYPVNILPKLPHNKISFFYHQSHTTTLSLNKTTLPFCVQEYQTVPVCVGSNNSNEVSIFNSFLVCVCKVLG